MFIYFGLIAAMVLAGRPAGAGPEARSAVPGPAVSVESPLRRHDI